MLNPFLAPRRGPAIATGTWTPVLTFATPGDLNVVYSTQVGNYYRIGDLVQVTFVATTSTFTHGSAASNLRLTGLPFTVANITGAQYFGSTLWQGITKANYTQVNPNAVLAQTYLEFRAFGSGQTAAVIAASDMPTGGSVSLRGTVSYAIG